MEDRVNGRPRKWIRTTETGTVAVDSPTMNHGEGDTIGGTSNKTMTISGVKKHGRPLKRTNPDTGDGEVGSLASRRCGACLMGYRR